jgi:DHA1 family multidrug resistance protein-like MFS transporter
MPRGALDRAYLALFREYPPLLRLAAVTGAGQTAFALLSVYALPVYLIEDLHISGLAVGGVTTVFLLSEMVLKFPLGRLSDRVGRKPFIVFGPLLIALNPIVMARLPVRLWTLIFPLRAVDGAGAAALWPPLFAMVGDLVRDRSRAAAMSVVNTVYLGAIGAAAAIGGLSADLSGSNRVPFYIVSGLLLVSALMAHLGLPGRSALLTEDSQAADPPEETEAEEAAEIHHHPLSTVLVVTVLMTLSVWTLANFLIVYIKVELGLSGTETGLLLAVMAVPVMLLGLPLGHAANQWGRSRAVRASLVVSAAAMWAVPFCHGVISFWLVAVVCVLSYMFGTPAWLALVSSLAPRSRRGGVMGIVATAEGAGAGLAPLLGGYLWDIHHSYIFFGAAALLTIGAVVAAVVLRGARD